MWRVWLMQTIFPSGKVLQTQSIITEIGSHGESIIQFWSRITTLRHLWRDISPVKRLFESLGCVHVQKGFVLDRCLCSQTLMSQQRLNCYAPIIIRSRLFNDSAESSRCLVSSEIDRKFPIDIRNESHRHSLYRVSLWLIKQCSFVLCHQRELVKFLKSAS